MPLHTHTVAIAQVLLASAILAVGDGISKHLGQHYPVTEFVSVRMWTFLVFTLWFAHRQIGLRTALRSRDLPRQLCRSALWCLEIVVFASALTTITLAEAHALFALYPLVVTLLAVPVLGERVGWRRIASVIVGFGGALLIIRPGAITLAPGTVLILSAMLMWCGYQLLTRLLSDREHFETNLLYMALVGSVLVPLAPVGGPWIWPTPVDALWMFALSGTSLVGHMLLVAALTRAPASTLQPFNFSIMVFAIGVGFVAFGDVPDAYTVCGALTIVGASLYVLARERRARSADRA
ncbi:MAG: DMT family transporter [Pseudomonadota bacterium]